MASSGEPRGPRGRPDVESPENKTEGGYAVDESGVPSMNNFWNFLPGGVSRKRFQLPRRRQMIAEMDRLLEEEFPHLDCEAITSRISEIANEIDALMHSGKTEAEFGPEIVKLGKEAREIEKQFRPLFNRLIELGFDIDFLQA